MVSVRCMWPGLPGGKVITAKRVPFTGGGVPRMRAPRTSTFSPIGITACRASEAHIMGAGGSAFVVRCLAIQDRLGDVIVVVTGHHPVDRPVFWLLAAHRGLLLLLASQPGATA